MLPPPMLGLDSVDEVALAAQQGYDPVAMMCLPPKETSSAGPEVASAPALPAIIFVMPLPGGGFDVLGGG